MRNPARAVTPRQNVGEARVRSARLSPTERRNPRSTDLDRLTVRQGIRLMLSEEARVSGKLLAKSSKIEHAIWHIVRSFRQGGRLFYVGAGTSGRLGVLDASECPPTFSTAPSLVQAILAGGPKAFFESRERAEDEPEAGAREIRRRRVDCRDSVVGITASGTTPFVWGAIREAKRRKATTILVCFNPFLHIPKPVRPDVLIDVNLGPEVLTGSTRLKAGTATKLLLNLFSTLSMVRRGKVVENLMADVDPSNVKLRGRAVRIVQELSGEESAAAQAALVGSGWSVNRALARLRRLPRGGARKLR